MEQVVLSENSSILHGLPIEFVCEAVSEGLMIFNLTGFLIIANSSAKHFLELDPDDLDSDAIVLHSDWLYEDGMPADLKELSSVFQGRILWTKRKIQLKTRSGNLRWLCITNSIAQEQLCVVNISDITQFQETLERSQRFQDEIQKREYFLKSSLNSLPELVSYIDSDFIYRFVNATYEKWFSVSKENIIGRSVVEILGEPAFQIVRHYMEAALEGHAQKFERQIPYHGAGERWVEVQYIPDFNPKGVNGFYAIIHDISEVVHSREETKKKEEELDRILDALPALVGHWDKNLINLHANRFYFDFYGITPENIKGKHIQELLGPKVYQLNLPFIKEVLKGKPQRFERELKLFQGGKRYVIADYLPEIENGEVIGFFVIVNDVTALKESELEKVNLLDQERKTRKEAQQATRMRDEMLAVVSHDLRNPLSVVLGSADLLLRKGDLDSKVSRALERIRKSVSIMLSMIKDLLDVYKIEQGSFALSEQKTFVDIGVFLHDIQDAQSMVAETKNITINLSVADKLPPVPMSYAEIVRVFQNLISNAVKFTPEGGHINLSAELSGNEIIFCVEDNGKGIDSTLLPHIFDRFVQAGETASLGVGLGLAISRGIIQAHGGKIWVESEVGKGSKFFITLPL